MASQYWSGEKETLTLPEEKSVTTVVRSLARERLPPKMGTSPIAPEAPFDSENTTEPSPRTERWKLVLIQVCDAKITDAEDTN